MVTKHQELTREELHQLVWSEPMYKLAKQFGVSDRGLAKICSRHRIPRPHRGYWQKLRAGHRVKPRKLPKLRKGEERLDPVVLSRAAASAPPGQEPSGPVWEREQFESQPGSRITVPKQLRRPHPLVAATRDHLRPPRRTRETLLEKRNVKDAPRLAVRVEKDSVTRALRIMNAFLKACEKRGWSVEGGTRQKPRTTVKVHGHKLDVTLEERRKAVRREPTEDQLRSYRLYGREPYLPLTYEPTGRLVLKIDEWYGRGRIRKTWADGKRQRVENCLNKVMVGLVRVAVAKTEWEKERAEKERRRTEELAWKEHERRRQEELRRRVERLERLASDSAKAQEIRAFLSRVRATATGSEEATEELKEWLAWAERYADGLDPLAGGVESLHRVPPRV